MKDRNKIIIMSVLIMALTSCSAFAQKPTGTPIPTATSSPTFGALAQKPTGTPVPTATSSPTLTTTPEPTITPTPTEKPTQTPDPIVVNAYAFMNPILEAIMDRSPDYQDDFSDPNSHWPSGRQPPSGHEEGVLGYENGEYFVMPDAAKFPWEADPSKKITCLSANHSPDVNVLDFVMEVDARYVTQSTDGDWQMKFWGGDEYYYGVILQYDGSASFLTNAPLSNYLDSNDLSGTEHTPSFQGAGSNHLVIIAKESQIAVTLNGQVVVFMDNLPPHKRGWIGFTVCNRGASAFRAQWDNLKIWNLSK